MTNNSSSDGCLNAFFIHFIGPVILFAILGVFLVGVSAIWKDINNPEEYFHCAYCEKSFPDSQLTSDDNWNSVCYKCAYENTITCPTCNEHIWYEKYDFLYELHPQHTTTCCNCDCEYLYRLIELQDDNGTVHTICPECYNYKYFELKTDCDYH